MADIAPIQGSYFGEHHGEFDSHLDLSLLVEKDLTKIAKHVEKTLASERVVLTMGGEPTFVPTEPEGPEWHFAAVGPTKLRYARAFAEKLVETVSPGAMILIQPGKIVSGRSQSTLGSPGIASGFEGTARDCQTPTRKALPTARRSS